MDGDWMAVEHLYQGQQARADRQKILPLVVNLADPSPSQGWQGLERKSLPDRGRPELTLCLALIHHIVIGANIPMRDFLGWLASLGTALVIEFVGRDDEMVETLLRNKDDQYADYSLENFESQLARHFAIQKKRPLKGGKRWIYFALPLANVAPPGGAEAPAAAGSVEVWLRQSICTNCHGSGDMSEAWPSTVRRASVVTVAGACLLGLAVLAGPARAVPRPNFVVLLTDDQRLHAHPHHAAGTRRRGPAAVACRPDPEYGPFGH